MKVTIVAPLRDSRDPPYRYRCLHLVAQLERLGAISMIVGVNEKTALQAVQTADVVILFRLPWSVAASALVSAARKQRVPVLFDIDDLIFDEDILDQMPFLRALPRAEQLDYRARVRALGLTLAQVDGCIGATPVIAEAAAQRGKASVVHRNALDADDEVRAEVISSHAPPRRHIIGYFSGSNTHDGDFESIADPLARVLTKQPLAQLLIVGFVRLPKRLAQFEHRVLVAPFLPATAYPWLLARCSAVVAPYEEVTRFVHAKSAVKVIEAGAVGVATVASPSSEYLRAIDHERTGFIAHSDDEWERGLEQLLSGPISVELGQRARQKVLAEHSARAATTSLSLALSTLAEQVDGLQGRLARRARGSFFRRRLPSSHVRMPPYSVDALATPLSADVPFDLQRLRTPGVDLIVPVYNAFSETKRCLESVRRHAPADCRIVVVDDASTDPLLPPWLETFAASDPRVLLHRNPKNLGFVGTANAGMGMSGERDVLLLNSDTEVYEGFLDRMVRCAYASPATGIVTALSNNATICSVPRFCEENDLPPGLSGEAFAALITAVSERAYPELPTGVGFCLFIKRVVLDRVGLFRQELFGRGYGEENDLCMRARALGYRVRLSDDVFVFHAGHASFSEETAALCEAHEKILRREHPSYGFEVTRFIETNPLARVHRRIDFALARRQASDGAVVMFVLHSSPFAAQPGGTELHVRDLLREMAYERAIVVFPEDTKLVAIEIAGGRLDAPVRYEIPIGAPSRWICTKHVGMEQAFAKVLNLFDVSLVHVHHFGFIPLELPVWLAARSIPLVITAHDYYLACPSFNGFNHSTRSQCACDSASAAGCLTTLSKAFGDESITQEGKEAHGLYMRLACDYAHAVVTPSARAQSRLLARLAHSVDGSKFRVVEHGCDRAPAIAQGESAPLLTKGTLRIGLLGAISHAIKGADAYLALVERTRELPIEWYVFGPIPHEGFVNEMSALGREGCVHFEGAYERSTIASRLHERAIALTLFLPTSEETYSYTVTESLLAGVPVVSGELGAGADRVRACHAGTVVAGVAEAANLIEALTRDPDRLREWRVNARSFETRTVASACAETKAIHNQALLTVQRATALLPATLQLEQLLPYFVPPEGSPKQKVDQTGWWKNSSGRAPLIHVELGRMVHKRVDAHIRSHLGRTRIVCKSADPQLHLELDPFASSSVSCLRFTARVPTRLTLEVFWTHHADELFSQEKSAFLILEATREPKPFELRFDQPAFAPAWTQGPWIHQLRVDPADRPCVIELSDVVLST